MKALLLLAALLPTGACLRAQAPVTTKLDQVTVFQNGAQLTRTGHAALPVGKSVLLFRGLSPKLDKNSLQVRGQGRFTVLSVAVQAGFAREKKDSEQTDLDARRDALADRLTVQQKLLAVYRQEEAMLLKNQSLNGQGVALKASELKEAVDFQRARLTEALLKQVEIEKTVKRLQADLKALDSTQTRLDTQAERLQSDVLVTVRATEAVPQAGFELRYFVPDAGWIPAYDVRVADLAAPLTLAYRANVFQFSDEDWNAVRLTLSTADPRLRGNKPELKPWFYGTQNDYSEYREPPGLFNPNVTQVSGRVTDSRSGEAIPGVTVRLKGTSLGVATDKEGYYKLSIPPKLPTGSGALVFSFVGYTTEERVISAERIDVKMKEDALALQEVVTVGYGTDNALQGRISGINVSKSRTTLPLDVEEREAPTSVSFDIKIPYTVPSDGQVYSVDIREEAVPAQYEYAAVPKVTPDAFLTAKIVDWERYTLLPGEASLFLEGTFVGKARLDPRSTADTLSLSLGRDASVQISRTKLKSQSRRQRLGSSRVEDRAYEIAVRNTRRQPIVLVLEDQFPLSKFKEIDIQNRNALEAASVDETTGKITWRLTVEPARERKVGFGYTVRAPWAGVVSTE